MDQVEATVEGRRIVKWPTRVKVAENDHDPHRDVRLRGGKVLIDAGNVLTQNERHTLDRVDGSPDSSATEGRR
jgi:hypothetical protein